MKRALLAVALIFAACSEQATETTPGAPGATVAALTAEAQQARVARGAYLVTVAACNDCHTPFKMGPNGPEPDMDRMLSGHPAEAIMPEPPQLGDGLWGWLGSVTNTAFAGPWGVSYTANLTPDPSGLSAWDEDLFIRTIRSGKHWATSRDILPPMPWQMYRSLTDEDLASIFAYLQTIPPIRNHVPEPRAPVPAS